MAGMWCPTPRRLWLPLLVAVTGHYGDHRHTPKLYRMVKYYLCCYQKIGAMELALKLHRAHLDSVLGDEMSPVRQRLKSRRGSVVGRTKFLRALLELAYKVYLVQGKRGAGR